ncbi:MAG: IS5 family transposase, partial [Parcubacteria group bacterium]
MYIKTEGQLILPSDFFLPFGGKLNNTNRWITLASLVPWGRVEALYAKSFKKSLKGQKALSIRVALGALIIQERCQLDDRETVLQIMENPYLQYFIGLAGYQESAPFHHSLLTHFRKRLTPEIIQQVNEWIAIAAAKDTDEQNPPHDDHPEDGPSQRKKTMNSEAIASSEGSNQGTLLLDATCTPADIAYPTDLTLLNEAREKLEGIIDVLHAPHAGTLIKPRTYREKARKAYLQVTKQRRMGKSKLRKAIGKQLAYVARNLRHVEQLQAKTSLTVLKRKQYKDLLVISELYRQQRIMYTSRSHQVDDRIVNIHQPHVRPIVRGKAKAKVEFGAKVAMSLVNGYALMEKVSWDNFNEGTTLIASAETYKARFGYYPKEILADQIYRNRDNIAFCKANGIRLSGPKLGRPSKEDSLVEQKRLTYQDSCDRNAIEGKFGEGKRRYGLGRIRARLVNTSETMISLQLLVMNLERKLRLFVVFFFNFFK